MKLRYVPLAALAVGALTLTSCGKVAEKAVEKASGCKNIDVKDESVAAECGDGSMQLGENAKVPDGLPKELHPPKGAKLSAAFTDKQDGARVFSLTMVVPGDAKTVAKDIRSQLRDGGYSITEDGLTEGSEGVGGNLAGRNDSWEARYNFASNPDPKSSDGGVFLIQTVRELTAEEKSQTTTTVEDSPSGSSDTNSDSSGDSGDSSEGTKLPDGFPSDLAPPTGVTVTGSSRNISGGQTVFYVTYTSKKSVSDQYKKIKNQLSEAGYTISVDNLGSVGSDSFGTLSADNSTYQVQAVVGPDSTDSGRTSVTMTVQDK